MIEEPRPPRRPRYAGKNPRRFDEKYKEHQPERYAADVEKVLASGKTPAGSHRPIMVREILDVLRVQPGEIAVDCTLGYGGHASELLRLVQPGGKLLAVDVDPLELPKTEQRLRQLGFPEDSLVIRRMNYAGVHQVIAEHAPNGADAVLADLGLSSMQIDDPRRGFTFKTSSPLDMRMNPQRGQSAADWLRKVTPEELAEALRENADEPAADRLANVIVRTAEDGVLSLTTQLADVVRGVYRVASQEDADLAVRRVFQAIRIEVNDELAALEQFLRMLPWCLKPGARVAVLSFHSGEDRRVKLAFKQGLREGVYSRIAEEAGRAEPAEQAANPRSRPAKLRWAIRSEAGEL